jgi:hypothetical protein
VPNPCFGGRRRGSWFTSPLGFSQPLWRLTESLGGVSRPYGFGEKSLRKTHTMDERVDKSQNKARRTPKPAKTERQQIFVRNLRWAIERLGLTLRALAEKAGVDEMWLRRAATQGIYWTKASGEEAVKKLEAFLGCPTDTLWEPDGVRFRSGVTDKHLRGRDQVSDFEKVVGHFEGCPPPLLSRALEIIEYYGRSIDDPSLEPPEEKYRQLLEQEDGVAFAWSRSSGWRFSEKLSDILIANINVVIEDLAVLGVPYASDIKIDADIISKTRYMFKARDLAYTIWKKAYSTAQNMTSADINDLVNQKQAEYNARQAEEAERAKHQAEEAERAKHQAEEAERAKQQDEEAERAKQIAADQALEADRQAQGVKISYKVVRKHTTSKE